ncbi:hypothetical protein ACFZAT_08400 [Streptomyces sp. NPDC008163]|uniref:hypothetical protein n=1 Tax=Streptomyces sp. NPDC008163 TaxID=3364818 RepID=UPI0036E1CF2A
MDADDDYTRAGVRPSPLAPLPDHRHVHTPWWQELWRRHAHITTPLRARGLTCDIEFGLSAYIVRVPLPDNTVLIIGPPQEPATERPPGDPEGWVATREHPIDPSRFEVIYDSSPSDDPSTHQRPEARHGGSAEPLIEAIDHRLAQLGLLPTSVPHARDLADAHDPSANLESTEAAAEVALDGGLRLTHTTYGSAHDSDSTTERTGAQPSTTTAAATATACGDALLDLTDQLNGSDSHVQAAALLRQVLDPDAGVLARLADFFEAAAEKAKEAEEDGAFDLAHDLADAAVGARNLAEDLETADARMRTLTSITSASRPPVSPSRTPSLPPRALPTTPPRHTR